MELRCNTPNWKESKTKHDDIITETFTEQAKVEASVEQLYGYFRARLELDDGIPELERRKHRAFLLKGLSNLSETYECLDASRPWLCYWILHSLELLGESAPAHLTSQIAAFIAKCQSPTGGFGGGPGQHAHLAPTYAAVNALCIIGTEEAYQVIDRVKLQDFILRMKQPDGSFIMHEGGEEDIRGAYCAASAAQLANIMAPELFDGTPEWMIRCQTFEGGFGGVPGMEAHGGYSFCGLAALVLMGKESLCDMKAFLRWLANRQQAFEGGFNGRTNKLVDGCYSFWQAGAFPVIHTILAKQGDEALSTENWLFHQGALQEYILICCQHYAGGLIDKPGKPRDYYHTCYTLSGLSTAQHFSIGRLQHEQLIIGNQDNELVPTHPLFNIGLEAVINARKYYDKLPIPQPKKTANVSSDIPH